jgi:hypothetical protein
MITPDDLKWVCAERDRLMEKAREAERNAYMQRNHPGVTAAATETTAFYDDDPPAFDERQSDAIAELIVELRAEFQNYIERRIAELQDENAVKLKSEVVDLPNFLRRRRNAA